MTRPVPLGEAMEELPRARPPRMSDHVEALWRLAGTLGQEAAVASVSIGSPRPPDWLARLHVRTRDEAALRMMGDRVGVPADAYFTHADGAVSWALRIHGLDLLVISERDDGVS
jgi:hypothetical protein